MPKFRTKISKVEIIQAGCIVFTITALYFGRYDAVQTWVAALLVIEALKKKTVKRRK